MKDVTRQAVLGAIEEYLACLEAPTPRPRSMQPSARIPLRVFKHAEPLDPDRGNIASLAGVERTIFLDEDDNPSRWLPSFAVATVGPGVGANERLLLNRVCTLSCAQTRGRIHPWTPHTALVQLGFVSEGGTYSAGETIYGYIAGRWRVVDATAAPEARLEPEYTEINRPDGTRGHLGLIGFHHQIAVYRGLLWHVALDYGADKPSLLIPIDARAVLELFRYREVPPGKKRRDALLHWVSEHWRRKVTDPEDALRVHEHLRGQTSFEWADGLRVRVMPSEEDKKRIKAGHKHAVDLTAPR